MLDNTVKRVPDRTALAVKRDGKWVKWTFKEYQVSPYFTDFEINFQFQV